MKSVDLEKFILGSNAKHHGCKPGSRWNDGCNKCWCLDNGGAACTLRGCEGKRNKHDVPVYTESEFASPDFRCEPGKPMMIDCNNCSCGKDGKTAACTKMMCYK